MAKVRLGAVAGAMSGSVGTWTFSHNRYGAYVRLRVKPTTPTSPYVELVKSVLSTKSAEWRALEVEAQTAWRAWADANPITDVLGDKQVLTGHSAYVSLNARLAFAGVASLPLPPVAAAPAALTTLSGTFDIGIGNFQLAFTPTPLSAGLRLYTQAAVLDSPGRSYVGNLLKLVLISSAAQATPLDIEDEVVERFGSLSVGQKVVVLGSVLDEASGLLSPPLRTEGLVVETAAP